MRVTSAITRGVTRHVAATRLLLRDARAGARAALLVARAIAGERTEEQRRAHTKAFGVFGGGDLALQAEAAIVFDDAAARAGMSATQAVGPMTSP